MSTQETLWVTTPLSIYNSTTFIKLCTTVWWWLIIKFIHSLSGQKFNEPSYGTSYVSAQYRVVNLLSSKSFNSSQFYWNVPLLKITLWLRDWRVSAIYPKLAWILLVNYIYSLINYCSYKFPLAPPPPRKWGRRRQISNVLFYYLFQILCKFHKSRLSTCIVWCLVFRFLVLVCVCIYI